MVLHAVFSGWESSTGKDFFLSKREIFLDKKAVHDVRISFPVSGNLALSSIFEN